MYQLSTPIEFVAIEIVETDEIKPQD